MVGHRTGGLTHCGIFVVYADLDYRIRSDGEGGLLWEWLCPLCGECIRREPFAFPADYPAKVEDRVGREA